MLQLAPFFLEHDNFKHDGEVLPVPYLDDAVSFVKQNFFVLKFQLFHFDKNVLSHSFLLIHLKWAFENSEISNF